MNKNDNQLLEWAELDCDSIDFDELESKLDSELEEQMADLERLEFDREKIGNPDTIGHTVMNVVWEQFINQVGVIAGEDFIKENRGLTLDLRDSAHIQTADNFAKGKIATHNDKIDYQQRYDDWQENFQHDKNGNVITHQTRSGKEEATLVAGARKPFDQGRPVGSAERGTDMDHTVSAGEIIRDPEANAHMTKKEQIAFANSKANLNEMDAGQNRSKGDESMTDWLDNPNKNGQKPNEIFDISEGQDKQYREKDAEARAEYEKQKKEGERRSNETGKQSQKEEAMRIGGKALRAVVMGLLASLIKDIIRKLIVWFRSGSRKLSTFIDSIKEAIHSFVSNLKEHLLNAVNILVTTIATAIFGAVIDEIKKALIFLKQGYKSVKEAIDFLKNPANNNMPLSLKMMEVSKIVIAGVTVANAIRFSQVFEEALMTFPVFAFQIPLIGSLASLIGMFLGALVSGLIGALALNLIDRLIAKKQRQLNQLQQIEKKNEILQTSDNLLVVTDSRTQQTKTEVMSNIVRRHQEGDMMRERSNQISARIAAVEEQEVKNEETLKNIDNLLNQI